MFNVEMTKDNIKNWCDAYGDRPSQAYYPSTWLNSAQSISCDWDKVNNAGAASWEIVLNENQILIQL